MTQRSIRPDSARPIFTAMPPALRIYFDHVWPVFWPWLIWNMVRVAAWHERTGRDALMAVDCFGNIRLVRMADAPAAEDLYTYEAPLVPCWEKAGLASGLPVELQSLLLGEKGLGMRGRGIAARAVFPATPLPLTPALARAIAMRLLVLASPRERGLPAPAPP